VEKISKLGAFGANTRVMIHSKNVYFTGAGKNITTNNTLSYRGTLPHASEMRLTPGIAHGEPFRGFHTGLYNRS
jgi:hypothetical protein